ncbi:ABC transporter substrate-binding protein [Salipaludibacillus sp. HK11]|uniref:ABC transporter substrate-binding protein n=1 Tax=Salipaludibacillus sp. HK11 TaxID=3394320 RepID=UPI0039FD073C
MMSKYVKGLIALMLVVSILAACGNDDDDVSENTNGEEEESSSEENTAEGSEGLDLSGTEISILLSKPEIAGEFETAVDEFSTETGVDVTIIPLAGGNAFERMTSLYSAGNAATLMMVGNEFKTFQDRLLDLSEESWMENVQPGMTDFVTVDDKVYGQPLTVEAFGFIYNKAILDEVIDGDFDPTSVRTHDDLENLMNELEAFEGVEPVHVSPMDWSLGAHLSNPLFAAQSEDRDERHQFMEDMIAGEVALEDNDVFMGWLKTFDMIKEFNDSKNSPLAPQYDDGPAALAGGNVGLWFMGNWAYPQLKELDPDGDYGFIPVPISNDASDYGNAQISVGVPSYWVIDESQSSEEEQEAAKVFLDWLVNTEAGQNHYVNEFNLIPVFDNFTVSPEDPISQSVLSYMEELNTLEWMNSYYPTDGFPAMGASMQKYLSDATDQEGFINEMEEYWASVE